ncbi:Smy2p NDAI_0C05790 [Naumovozyma dairenensis CBS 421]|uniref:GYF domain-containing protein n=1 Tax=Naumovozyma dairenensis (strain ATCC 10597 / BCRC 20456 / CBS 421 / NBRC 0211 / NRRL Y-12639) TaxID=1071378 RepID=G0W8X7_NAUDC|nr:hypothetical protein NDAI_0C05790 [Naumovozyma dairenensis CBS 421]CCD24238.1 hypothetical protein NDAI_0C05790 [Naumovozyma dairenensis CBS 421]
MNFESQGQYESQAQSQPQTISDLDRDINLETLNYQLNDLNFHKTGSNAEDLFTQPLNNNSNNEMDSANATSAILGNRLPLSRSASLLDSIGIQRASSPFTPKSKDAGLTSTQSVLGSSIFNNWQHTAAATIPESQPSNQQIPFLSRQDSSSSFNYPSQLANFKNPLSSQFIVDTGYVDSPLIHSATPLTSTSQQQSNLFAPQLYTPSSSNVMPIVLESKWKYIDSTGTVQGPFSTSEMASWNQQGYFQPVLQICRVDTSLEPLGINDKFITLGELSGLVNDLINPFNTFDNLVARMPIDSLSKNNNKEVVKQEEKLTLQKETMSKVLEKSLQTNTKSKTKSEAKNKEPSKNDKEIQKPAISESEKYAQALLEREHKKKQNKADMVAKQLLAEEEKRKQKQKADQERKKDTQLFSADHKNNTDQQKEKVIRATVNGSGEEDIKNQSLNKWSTTATTTNLKKTNDLTSSTPVEEKIHSTTTSAQPKINSESLESLPSKSQSKNEKPETEEFDVSFIEEQKKIWESVRRTSKPSKNTTKASSINNAWTTVTSKAKPTSTKAQSTINKPTIGSFTVNPNLKAKTVVSAASPAASNGINPGISPRQEFLKWCKSQMKLNQGITSNTVLELLLSLPSGQESKELIAETIYANSAVMDGNRFATEFIKRRNECEKHHHEDPLSWNEALALSGNDDSDWEFQTVKKKGRKH